jgi:hypothetical protein
VRFHPPADQAPSLIERARPMLVAATVQQTEIASESRQEAQLLNPQICLSQVL